MTKYIFNLPDIGEGIAEAEIVKWHIKIGDVVAEDDQLADVMTDKATVEMEAPVSGTITALAGEEGDIIAIGSMLVEIEVEGASNVVGVGTDNLRLCDTPLVPLLAPLWTRAAGAWHVLAAWAEATLPELHATLAPPADSQAWANTDPDPDPKPDPNPNLNLNPNPNPNSTPTPTLSRRGQPSSVRWSCRRTRRASPRCARCGPSTTGSASRSTSRSP